MENPFMASGWGNPFVDKRGWYYYDLACVLLFDWMQMSIIGAIALVGMVITSVGMALKAARRAAPHSVEGFVGLASLGIITGKFAHGMLDTFWIARGSNLHTWAAVGMALFLTLWLEQNQRSVSKAKARPVRATAGALR